MTRSGRRDAPTAAAAVVREALARLLEHASLEESVQLELEGVELGGGSSRGDGDEAHH